MSAVLLDPPTLDSPDTTIPAPAPNKPSSKKGKITSFVNLFRPEIVEPIKIPPQVTHVIIGHQGFFCDAGGLDGFKKQINTPDFTDGSNNFEVTSHTETVNGVEYTFIEDSAGNVILLLDTGNYLNVGFTHRLSEYLPAFTDAVVQSFGAPAALLGHSGGIFHSIGIAAQFPDHIRRMFFTSGPHELTLDPQDLKQHTNIAPLLSPMTRRGTRRFFDQSRIEGWAEYKRGEDTDRAHQIRAALEAIDIVSFAASDDFVVRGQKCAFENGPKRRFLVFNGIHSDAGEKAGPAIRFLTVQDDIHAQLPPEASKSLVPAEEMKDMPKVRTSTIVREHLTHKHNRPEEVGQTPIGVDAPQEGRAHFHGINVPAEWLRRASSLHLPTPALSAARHLLPLLVR